MGSHAIPISSDDLAWGSLPGPGFVRPMYLFSGNEDQFEKKATVNDAMLQRILDTVRTNVGRP